MNTTTVIHEGQYQTTSNIYTFTTFDADIDTFTNVKSGITEQVAAIIGLLFIICMVLLCLYWLITLWNHRDMRAYKFTLKVRHLKVTLPPYLLFLSLLLERSISIVYYYFSSEQKGIYYGDFLVQTIYDESADQVLHYMFWFGFWAFVQSKMFKILLMRYWYEYEKEMKNIEWKEHLGLSTVEPASCWIRYRSSLGNNKRMFILQFMIVMIMFIIQIFVGFPMGEQIMILVMISVELLIIIWIIYQIKAIDDDFYIKREIKYHIIIHAIFIVLWIVGLIIYANTESVVGSLDGSYICMVWIAILCYCETVWILKRIDEDWMKKRIEIRYYDDNNIRYPKLEDILERQEGFEMMMRFLVKEFSCENLLCYVEFLQYIEMWSSMNPIKERFNKSRMRCNLMIIGYLKDECKELPHDVICMIIAYYMRLYFGDNEVSKENMINKDLYNILNRTDDKSVMLEMTNINLKEKIQKEDNINYAYLEFNYFQKPQFDDEYIHFQYLMQKYIDDTAALQINISGSLRNECFKYMRREWQHENIDTFHRLILSIMDELWSLMRDSFTRFRSTDDYQKWIDILSNSK